MGGLEAAGEAVEVPSGHGEQVSRVSAPARLVGLRGGRSRIEQAAEPGGRTEPVISRAPAPRPAAVDAAPRRWFARYRAGLVVADLLVAAVAVLVSYLIRFGSVVGTPDAQAYITLGALLPFAWVASVAFNRAYESRYVGVGPSEFQRIFQAFLHLTALVAFGSFVTHADLARGFVLVALPSALVLDLVARYAARKWLHAQRGRGLALSSVLVVGDAESIASFTSVVRRDQYAGMRVVGACVPAESTVDPGCITTLDQIAIPLLGDIDSVRSALTMSGADTVAVVSSPVVGAEKLRWISWQLEGSDAELMVSPGLTEVAGPRLHIRPVAGLPLVHVEAPQFSGFRRVLKSAFDRTVSLAALLVLSPLLVVLALAVRLTSSGPALFRQTRVGRDGSTFTMVKFRSMRVDAEEQQQELADANVHGDGVLFKMPDDPRVTRVGRFLRKYSLDELPQLLNVVHGSMSLVGPRPPLPREVARYETHVHRRLLVKPGLTGLWQVSGRSDLSWEESVRLDLRYVENWSLAEDLMILWKTVRAVVASAGAY